MQNFTSNIASNNNVNSNRKCMLKKSSRGKKVEVSLFCFWYCDHIFPIIVLDVPRG